MHRRFYLGAIPYSVLVIVIISSLVELYLIGCEADLWGTPFRRTQFYGLGAFWIVLLNGGPPLFPGQPVSMFMTYAFLHGDWLHLLVNVIALGSFGTAIVNRVGQKRFLLAYALASMGGAAGFGLLSTNPAPMVGASGALFGLLGIWVCWDYLDRRHYGESLWVTARAIVFLILYNLVFWVLLSGNLAWETHLGGFLTGWLLALYWGRPVFLQSRRRRDGTGEPRTE